MKIYSINLILLELYFVMICIDSIFFYTLNFVQDQIEHNELESFELFTVFMITCFKKITIILI